MKNGKVHIALIVAVLVAAVTVISFSARGSRGQAQRRKGETPVKSTVRITERPMSSNTSVAFAAAATKNAALKNELSWTFGGKQQRGWYLYDLLIGKTSRVTTTQLQVNLRRPSRAGKRDRD